MPKSSAPPGINAALMKSKDFFKIAKIYGGLPLIASIPGSLADRAGLRRGDIVISVNGLPTPDMDAFVAARNAERDRATVRFVRDGVEQEVVLDWTTRRDETPAHT